MAVIPERANAARLLELAQQYWCGEDGLHYRLEQHWSSPANQPLSDFGLRISSRRAVAPSQRVGFRFVLPKLQPFWLQLLEDDATEGRPTGDYARAAPAFGRRKPTEVGAPAAAARRRISSGSRGFPERRLQSA
jgi:hypothetical protein